MSQANFPSPKYFLIILFKTKLLLSLKKEKVMKEKVIIVKEFEDRSIH